MKSFLIQWHFAELMKRNIKDTDQYNEIKDMQKTRSRNLFDSLLKAHRRRYGPGNFFNSISYCELKFLLILEKWPSIMTSALRGDGGWPKSVCSKGRCVDHIL